MPNRGSSGRRGLGVALTAVVVLVAGIVLAGVGAADPLLGTPLVAADPDGFARDHGVPVPDVPPCLPTARACVELATNHAWLMEAGRVVKPVLVMDPAPL